MASFISWFCNPSISDDSHYCFNHGPGESVGRAMYRQKGWPWTYGLPRTPKQCCFSSLQRFVPFLVSWLHREEDKFGKRCGWPQCCLSA